MFVIESREHLVGLLAEAAEVEHDLMCTYLYAAFSLEEAECAGVTGEAELAAVRRWRREIIAVAVEEMTHLVLVSNVISAIGGVPYFGRYNFPIPVGALPASLSVRLAKFSEAVLDHFIFLERPEEAAIDDGAGFTTSSAYRRVSVAGRLMPTPSDYRTVGALYRAIRDGLSGLVERHGATAIFIGAPEQQLGPEVGLPGVIRVRCLSSACDALDNIVTQGEGAPGPHARSHFERFSAIRSELLALRAARPAFEPARPAAENPVMRAPPEPEGRVWVDLQPAANVLDFANSAYILMLRLLAQAYAETRGEREQRALVAASVELMHVLSPVASLLATLPANAVHPGVTAGISFATIRGNTALPPGPIADLVIVERMRQLGSRAEQLRDVLPDGIGEQLQRAKLRLETALQAVPPPEPEASPVEVAEGQALTIHFHGKRCVHARQCVLGQPRVFKANVDGPWIDPDATSVEAVIATVQLCPSGALQYVRKDGGDPEGPPPVNLISLRENGPLAVRAALRIAGNDVGFRATLCRCGASRRKPFCDGSHIRLGFTASGEPTSRDSVPLDRRDGYLEVTPQRDGPLVVSGNLEICAGTGRTIDRVTGVRLCRCGGSGNKPFCDGSHARIGFVADGE